MTSTVFLSLIIPAFNEAKKIRQDITLAHEYLSRQTFPYEVIVVDDGSNDETHTIAKSLEKEYRNLRCIRCLQNRGKGHAVKTGVLQSRGEIVFFADAGTCVPYTETEKGIDFLKDGYDIAIGSRALADSKVVLRQPPYRQIGSKVFGVLAKYFMGVHHIKDLQCGFKFFKREAAMAIFPTNTINGMMFDIETIIKAKKLGFKIKEFPVSWKNDPDTRFHPVWGGLNSLKELLIIKFGK